MRKFQVMFDGVLNDKYEPIEVYGSSIRQILKGINHQYPDFIKQLTEYGHWVFLMFDSKNKKELFITEDLLLNDFRFDAYDQLIIAPNIEGSFFLAPLIMVALQAAASAALAVGTAVIGAVGSGLSAIGGAALGAAGVGATGAAAGAAAGAATITAVNVVAGVLVVGAMYGITQALTPSIPKIGNHAAAAGGDQPSFLYNTPPNVSDAGNPIPLIYGQTRVGVTVISAAVHTIDTSPEKEPPKPIITQVGRVNPNG